MITQRILPNDICRCHDFHCPENQTCLRFLQRAMALGRGDNVVAADSLRQPGEKCRMKIEDEK